MLGYGKWCIHGCRHVFFSIFLIASSGNAPHAIATAQSTTLLNKYAGVHKSTKPARDSRRPNARQIEHGLFARDASARGIAVSRKSCLVCTGLATVPNCAK